MKADPPGRISIRDVVAGLSVALVLIPQSMAYAELAGLPPHHGLYAATLPLIAAAFFASSPYLQSGPVALAGLLTYGALVPMAPLRTAEFAALAALLALVVGVGRLLIGLFKAGWVVYLMSHAMMRGFLSAAAVLILASQLPGALGSMPPADEGVLQGAWWALSRPHSWEAAAIGLAALTVVIVRVASRIHPVVPGVLVASIVGLVYSVLSDYTGPVVGAIPRGLPPFSADLPWAQLPALIVPGLVISVVGFADGVAISRVFASRDRQRWVADREFLGSGSACIVAAFTGGLPVGGSLSRTSLNRLAGARSRWSGLVTGLAVLCFLPFADIMSALPRAVLSGIVISAIASLIRPQDIWGMWKVSPPQALVGWGTFCAMLVLSPRIDQAVLVGMSMAAAVHLWRELKPYVTSARDGDTLTVELSGVLWFGSAPALEDLILAQVAEEPDVTRVVIRCGGLGRIDLSGAHTLCEMVNQAASAGFEMVLEDVPDHAKRHLMAVGLAVDCGPEVPSGTGTTPRP